MNKELGQILLLDDCVTNSGITGGDYPLLTRGIAVCEYIKGLKFFYANTGVNFTVYLWKHFGPGFRRRFSKRSVQRELERYRQSGKPRGDLTKKINEDVERWFPHEEYAENIRGVAVTTFRQGLDFAQKNTKPTSYEIDGVNFGDIDFMFDKGRLEGMLLFYAVTGKVKP